MYRILERRLLLGVSAVALLALAGGAITALTQGARAGGNDDEAPVAPGTPPPSLRARYQTRVIYGQ